MKPKENMKYFYHIINNAMWPQDTKNYLNQMKRSETMNRINKEKEMQREIMSLKAENQNLKDEIRQFADWFQILARKLKESNEENKKLKQTQFLPF